MTIHDARQYLTVQLTPVYEDREAANIADWVMEHLTGLKKIDRIIHKATPLSATQVSQLTSYTASLLAHKPVQYVLNEAWFYGLHLYVDEQVLIPRPETEELVEWVVEEVRSQYPVSRSSSYVAVPVAPGPRILDIGTGSGCIPIALKHELPAAAVYACDVSAGALQVAQKNAQALGTAVQFFHVDMLQPAHWPSLPEVDVIVSNPPYIPVKDKATMRENVLQHEPHLALFVEDDDPLLFYRTIARFASRHLRPGGKIYVEIHEDLGAATTALFAASGFTDIVLKKDLQGRDRMVRAVKSA